MTDDVQSNGSLIADYFKDLFTAEVAIPDEEVLNKVTPRVIDYMNESLLAPYTAEEVKSALFSIGDIKATDPDGLHAIFIKKIDHSLVIIWSKRYLMLLILVLY